MQLRTERLILRAVSSADLQDIHALHSLPQTDEYNTLGIPSSLKVTELLLNEWLQKQQQRSSYIFCITLADTNDLIGLIAFNIGRPDYKTAEIWYKLLPSFWRKGYATEALKEMIRFGFIDLQLHRLEAGCAVENKASVKVLEKAGMILEGRKRKILPIRGEWSDNYFYAMLETDLK